MLKGKENIVAFCIKVISKNGNIIQNNAINYKWNSRFFKY